MAHEKLRRLPIDLLELDLAFQVDEPDVTYYMDLEDGTVLLVTAELRSELDEVYEQAWAEVGSSQGEDREAVARRCAQLIWESDREEWHRLDLLGALSIEVAPPDQYAEVPRFETRDAYAEMEDFIATIQSGRLRDRLERAIAGKGAFRRFKEIVYQISEEEQRWYAFRDGRRRQRMVDWLEELGIEPAES